MKTETKMTLADEIASMKALTASPVLHDICNRAAAALEAKDEALRMVLKWRGIQSSQAIEQARAALALGQES